MGGLLSFLSGSAFRMVWGEVSHWLTAKQEHKHELERMKLQSEAEAGAHARNLESMRLQSEIGIKEIGVKSEAVIAETDTASWGDALRSIGEKSGIAWVDAWNQSIRPLLATISILAILIEVVCTGFILNDWHREIIGAILGLYVADRSLAKRGK